MNWRGGLHGKQAAATWKPSRYLLKERENQENLRTEGRSQDLADAY
jgi:hypothetical protein